MPSDHELSEFMEAHPTVRVLNTGLGEIPVVPFYDVVGLLRQARDEGYEYGYNSNDTAYMEGFHKGQKDEREKHHVNQCCRICDTHVNPHRGCILR
jgi:hypothetical protein